MPTANFGTLATLDTLASSTQTIAEIGEDRAFDAIDRSLAAHNAIANLMTAEFSETTTDKQRRYGTPSSMNMQELDEFGSPDAEKVIAGTIVGFPLRLYGDAVQWTRKYMQNATGQEIAAQMTGMMDADVLKIITLVKRALFSPINYTTNDRFVRNVSTIPIQVKALANADGAGLPVGPNGEVFNGATHTHYLTCATPGTVTATDANALVNTVLEHFATGSPRLYIAKGDETTWRAVPGFVPYTDVRIAQPTTMVSIPGTALDVVNIMNRAIGIFNGAEVWVKPWMIQGYAFSWLKGQQPPLCKRIRATTTDALVLVADDEDHPLRARQYEREVGFGVFNRVNGALLDMTHNVYTAPVIQ